MNIYNEFEKDNGFGDLIESCVVSLTKWKQKKNAAIWFSWV